MPNFCYESIIFAVRYICATNYLLSVSIIAPWNGYRRPLLRRVLKIGTRYVKVLPEPVHEFMKKLW